MKTRSVPPHLQLEVINLQGKDMLKGKHQERKLFDFYNCLPSAIYSQLK